MSDDGGATPGRPAAAAVLVASDLEVGFERRRARRSLLAHLNVGVGPGDLVCVLGMNGVGKSTLLRTLAGLQRPLSGRVSLLGEDLAALSPTEVARRLAVVLTERTGARALTVRELVSLGRLPYVGWAGGLGPADRQVVERTLEETGTAELRDRRVGELSDGERQRVWIARALAQEPRVLLLDEPTAFLDPPRRSEITSLIERLAEHGGLAVVLATHDLALAVAAKRLWLLEAGDPETPGTCSEGNPVELARSGALARAFRRTGSDFDLARELGRLAEFSALLERPG